MIFFINYKNHVKISKMRRISAAVTESLIAISASIRKEI